MTRPADSPLRKHRPKRRARFFFLWAFALTLLYAACNDPFVFKSEKDIAGGQWAYRDTLDFSFAMTDTSATYNLYVDFEYVDTFSTQNLYVKLHTLFPDGKRLSKQKSFDLFDVQGKPLGECSGHKCRLHALLQEKAYFNQPGTYTITVEQFTRRDPLPGIFAVGLSVESTGGKR